MENIKEILEGVYNSDDYRAGILVLEICCAMQDVAVLTSLAATIVEIVAYKSGLSIDEAMQMMQDASEHTRERR